MTADTMSTTARETAHAARHLIHRPTSWEHCLLDAPSSGGECFVLVGCLPTRHPVFNDGAGHFHDPQYVLGELREIGEFVGHQFFGVPGERPVHLSRLALTLTDLPAWRVEGAQPPRLTVDLTARPEPSTGAGPRGLAFGVEVRLDEVPCGAGEADLLFPVPAPHPGRIERRVLIEHGGPAVQVARLRGAAPADAGRPVDPVEVGRRSPGNVLVREPSVSARGRLTTWVLPGAASPDLGQDGLLLEALRQASLLTAVRTCGYDPALALVSGWEVRLPARAEGELPLRCVAVPGVLDKDADGRPSVPITLTVTQRQRVVAWARARVVQDL